MVLAMMAASGLLALSAQAAPAAQAFDLERGNSYLNRALSRGTSSARMISPSGAEVGLGSPVVKWEGAGCSARMSTATRTWSFDWREVSSVSPNLEGVSINGPISDGSQRRAGIYLAVPSGELRQNVLATLRGVKSACPDSL